MLKHVDNKVVIKIDPENKNFWTFSNGEKIRLERQYNNLNRRETEPVNAFVVSAEDIPEGAEILIHHNAIHDSYKIFNYTQLSGEEIASTWKYYSIPIEMCYLYREGEDWLPLKGFATALRVFEPYQGLIEGIPPKQLKNVLYITKGDYEGNVVHTLVACDYEIIFQGTNGKEQRVIRLLPNGDERLQKEPEVIMVYNNYTEKVKRGKLLVGLSISDAKPLKEFNLG